MTIIRGSYLKEERERSLITIYNILGQLVQTLVDAFWNVGEYEVIWDGRNSDRVSVASGIYFCVFHYNYEVQAIEKMIKM